jgi:hypothetical protein
MSNRSIRKVVGRYLTEAAYSLLAAGTGLSEEDVRRLREEGPKLAKKIKNAKKGKPFEGVSDDDKRLLLAYVVYFRQNLTMENSAKPNDEDAAKILHGEIFKGDDKKTKERLAEELVRQLQKSGIKLEDN